jgi:outer membrane immunogenic protein
MKRVVFASIGLVALALAGTASAADLPRRMVVQQAAAPIAVPVAYNWTGFYAGINGGWGFGNSAWVDRIGSTGDFDVSGGLVGGTLGYQRPHPGHLSARLHNQQRLARHHARAPWLRC